MTTPDLLSGLVIRILLFDRRDLFALRHSLCIKKIASINSRASVSVRKIAQFGFQSGVLTDHFIIDGFIPHVLSTICLHCINAVVALRVIWVICGYQVGLLSRVTPNSLVSLESSSSKKFIDKKPKAGLRL